MTTKEQIKKYTFKYCPDCGRKIRKDDHLCICEMDNNMMMSDAD
jgi:hypothetical protein